MLQSGTGTSVISCCDLKENCDLFSFLYLVSEEGKVSLATRCSRVYFPVCGEEQKCVERVYGFELIRLHGHSWGTLICLRLHYTRGDMGPHFLSSFEFILLQSYAEHELEYWFSVKHSLADVAICFKQGKVNRMRAVISWGWILSDVSTRLMLIISICSVSNSNASSWQSAASNIPTCRQMCDKGGRRDQIVAYVNSSLDQSH